MTSRVASAAGQMRAAAARVLVGQDEPFELLLTGLFSGGHVLLEGVPGTAKTLMAKTLALLIGARFSRVQCTPDLMPSDVVGTSVYDLGAGRFTLRKGPVFTNILLVDEINRAPAKTQSALLEVMEERQVTIDGTSHHLAAPFMTVATQNPVEYEGTYPLPEAQLDRFLFKVLVDYPTADWERRMLRNVDRGFDAADLAAAGLEAVLTAETLAEVRAEIGRVTVDPSIIDYIAAISAQSRRSGDLVLGGSPRASIALLLAAKTTAAMEGRDYVVPDDVKALVPPVFRHRILLKPEAEIDGLTADGALARIMGRVPVPR
jgi:MoxR-like ATPase